jgi:hypothetical protein
LLKQFKAGFSFKNLDVRRARKESKLYYAESRIEDGGVNYEENGCNFLKGTAESNIDKK